MTNSSKYKMCKTTYLTYFQLNICNKLPVLCPVLKPYEWEILHNAEFTYKYIIERITTHVSWIYAMRIAIINVNA